MRPGHVYGVSDFLCDLFTWLSARLAVDSDDDFLDSDPLAGASAAWMGPSPRALTSHSSVAS